MSFAALISENSRLRSGAERKPLARERRRGYLVGSTGAGATGIVATEERVLSFLQPGTGLLFIHYPSAERGAQPMTPMFFGASESPLFGMLTEPEGEARGHGVVLCPPIGQEHVRAHWAFRQMALALSRAGFHGFRFDWSGVGDSSGDLTTASLARWKNDAVQAAQELRDTTGVRKVSLLGLRLGGTLAAFAAAQIKPSCLLLWDPVVSGAHYLAELQRVQAELFSGETRFWRPVSSEPGSPGFRPTRPTELVGFDFGKELAEEIAHIEMASVARLPKTRVCLIRSSLSTDLAEFSELLRARKVEYELHATEMWAQWSTASEIEELLLPADTARVIADYLARRAP